MRRSERQITDQATIEHILHKADVCRIALMDHLYPYIVPVNFGYQDNCVYFHSAEQGRKIDLIKANNRVCFEAEINTQIVPGKTACEWTMHYTSVIGVGRAYIVESLAEKRHGLNVIMQKFAEQSFEYSDAALHRVAVIKIEIEEISGKQSK